MNRGEGLLEGRGENDQNSATRDGDDESLRCSSSFTRLADASVSGAVVIMVPKGDQLEELSADEVPFRRLILAEWLKMQWIHPRNFIWRETEVIMNGAVHRFSKNPFGVQTKSAWVTLSGPICLDQLDRNCHRREFRAPAPIRVG